VNCEHELAVAVIDTLLRENYSGLARFVRPGPSASLALPGGLVLPLRPDGFLADLRIDAGAGAGLPLLSLADVDGVVAALADPRDACGVGAFRDECRQALAAMQLMRSRSLRPGPACYDALAARMPHPAYPTWASRAGWSAADSLRYAPEFMPSFWLRWVAIPRGAVTGPSAAGPSAAVPSKSGPESRPGCVAGWWPGPDDVGLPPALGRTHALFPVHPLTARTVLGTALTEAGLADSAVLAPRSFLRVRPTLSTRTVVVAEAGGAGAEVHIKLPLASSTLGLRNRRAIAPGTLTDGALVHRILVAAAAADPWLGRHLLIADDENFAHAGHPFLGYLLRLFPGGLLDCRVVPVAALLAPAGGSGLVLDDLADGDVPRWFRGYLDVLFGVAVRLFVRFGIALESHQQNAAIVAGGGSPRLLVKDFDGTLINYARLEAALGSTALGSMDVSRASFADRRLLTDSDNALADVFITITVHLCAGAIAFGLASRFPVAYLLGLVRAALVAALDSCGRYPAAGLLRVRVLEADRLPGKAMVTAGTLVDKSRTGASDINKFYGTSGPNYLRLAAAA
jgi:siderophore synthetase component